jgi:hypothetical protein
VPPNFITTISPVWVALIATENRRVPRGARTSRPDRTGSGRCDPSHTHAYISE